MTAIHELKTDPEPFAASLRGDKPYEIRLDDRGFKSGDVLVLRETKYSGAEMANGEPLEYTGRVLVGCVTEVRSGYGLKDGWVILGVRAVNCSACREIQGNFLSRDGEVQKLKQLLKASDVNDASIARPSAGREE